MTTTNQSRRHTTFLRTNLSPKQLLPRQPLHFLGSSAVQYTPARSVPLSVPVWKGADCFRLPREPLIQTTSHLTPLHFLGSLAVQWAVPVLCPFGRSRLLAASSRAAHPNSSTLDTGGPSSRMSCVLWGFSSNARTSSCRAVSLLLCTKYEKYSFTFNAVSFLWSCLYYTAALPSLSVACPFETKKITNIEIQQLSALM